MPILLSFTLAKGFRIEPVLLFLSLGGLVMTLISLYYSNQYDDERDVISSPNFNGNQNLNSSDSDSHSSTPFLSTPIPYHYTHAYPGWESDDEGYEGEREDCHRDDDTCLSL